jgi:hypothetical protein
MEKLWRCGGEMLQESEWGQGGAVRCCISSNKAKALPRRQDLSFRFHLYGQ